MNNQSNSTWSLVGISGKWSYALLGIDERLSTFRTCAAIMPETFKVEGNRLYANMSNWHDKRSK